MDETPPPSRGPLDPPPSASGPSAPADAPPPSAAPPPPEPFDVGSHASGERLGPWNELGAVLFYVGYAGTFLLAACRADSMVSVLYMVFGILSNVRLSTSMLGTLVFNQGLLVLAPGVVEVLMLITFERLRTTRDGRHLPRMRKLLIAEIVLGAVAISMTSMDFIAFVALGLALALFAFFELYDWVSRAFPVLPTYSEMLLESAGRNLDDTP